MSAGMGNLRSGREREAESIHEANRAAAVGRLMLGELDTWQEFLQADVIDLEGLARRQIKIGASDVRRRLSKEIRRFCSRNFHGMDVKKLSLLYEEIKAYRGLELPLSDFEEKYAPIRHETLKGNPVHSTVCVSLWGLQFRFPEDYLAKDLATALQLSSEAQREEQRYEQNSHFQLKCDKDEVTSMLRKKGFAVRSALNCCFSLMEAYLNGLAWEYVASHDSSEWSNQKRKRLEDSTSVSIREKLWRYPEDLTGRKLWEEADQEANGFIDTLKPFRDSLIHPSPFSAPERFGGYDKLRLFYRIDDDTARLAAQLLINLTKRIHRHVHVESKHIPDWVSTLESELPTIGELQ